MTINPDMMDPTAAFPDQRKEPTLKKLAAALGPAWPKVEVIRQRLHAAHPEVQDSWQFSARSGWYQVPIQKKRRLLYLVPKRGGFRLMIILGRKAVASFHGGPLARPVATLLKTARHYPEGIAFEFSPASLNPGLFLGLLEAKLAH